MIMEIMLYRKVALHCFNDVKPDILVAVFQTEYETPIFEILSLILGTKLLLYAKVPYKTTARMKRNIDVECIHISVIMR